MRKSCIPNIFTFINLSCGVFSLLSTFEKQYVLQVSSDLGKELDSLADLVSFGVAPSVLIYILFNLNTFGPKGILGIILLIAFPICGAYRLARYNTSSFDGVFTGVPITITGCFLAAFALIANYAQAPVFLAIIFMILGAYLMVSKIHLKKI